MPNLRQITVKGSVSRTAIFVAMNDPPQTATAKRPPA
jgi:hypothetical protein